jgi:hypothetical protein
MVILLWFCWAMTHQILKTISMEKLKENKGLVIFPPPINMKSQQIMREFSLGLFSWLVRFVWIGSMVVANNDFDDLC